MKTIKFVGYLFYRYYSKGPRANIPYFSSICAMTLLSYFHVMQILIITDSMDIIRINPDDPKYIRWFYLSMLFIPLYFLMTLLFKKKDIDLLKEKYDANWDKVFAGNVWLIIYSILSFALIFILTFLKK